MAERNRDETFMINAAGDANVLIAVTAIEKEARKVCCDQFLAALFLKMANDGRYKILKTKLNNDFIFGDDNAPLMIVEAKRVLSDYIVPVNSKVDPDDNEVYDGTGLAFAETQEWVKTTPCYGCGGKVHLLSNFKKTPPDRKKAIYAMVKTGNFKTSSKGVVQVEAGKGSYESNAPSDNNYVEKFVNFVGVQELNVGKSDNKPNFEDDSFGFFGINFGKVGEI